MSDLQNRLEQLARRGKPRGGDAVLDAAKASVEQDSVTVIGMDQSRGRPRRHFSSLVAAAGVAATLFVGTLAFSAFIGAGSGSDSPEGAVRQLAEAVANEDALAAADVLAPEEVRSLSRTVDGAARRAEQLQLARTASAPLAGLDLSVDGLDLSTETLADGYVKVIVSGGTISAGTNKDEFSPLMQRVLRNSSDNEGRVDLARLSKDLDTPTFVVTVQRGGNWYVSAAYTVLEYIRVANDLPAADFGSGIRATATLGADSPEAAVTEAMQALSRSDWPTLISLAPPGEIPVYDYRDALIQLADDEDTDFTIDDMQTTTSIDGDTAKVLLKARGTTESGEWSLDGGCFKPPLNDEEGFQIDVTNEDWCGVNTFLAVPFYGTQSQSARKAEFTAVRKDGRWFVSPVGTVLDLVDRYVNDLTQRQLYTLLGVPELLPPDGELTLGQPVTVGDSFGAAHVYTLDAQRGQSLLGLATSTDQSEENNGAAEVLVYSADGEILPNTYDLIDGSGLKIPADGTYTVVIRAFYRQTTFTVWNEADAPDAAKHPIDEGMYDGCRPTGNSGMTCSSSSSSGSDFSGPDTSDGMSDSSGSCLVHPDGTTECTGAEGEVCTSLPDGSMECTSSPSSSGSGSGATTATTALPGPSG